MPHIQYAWWNELSLQLLCQQNSLRIHYYLNYINFDCLKGTINSVPLKNSKFYRYQNFHFGFRMINSIPKMLDLNTLTPYFYFFTFHGSSKAWTKFTIHPKKKRPIMPYRHAPLSRHHINYFAVSRITPRKNGQFRHHANHWAYLENDTSLIKVINKFVLKCYHLRSF